MKQARIVIGANYGDEGKGTVVAHYTKNAEGSVLNVLTNGGAQRGHSILTEDGSMTFKHFGSGTYYGADNYYSRYFILNPMQFVQEYEALIVKPRNIYRDPDCRWSTPYDSMANIITEHFRARQASCGMGIWNTICRYAKGPHMKFDEFVSAESLHFGKARRFLEDVKRYYEDVEKIPLSDQWKKIWNAEGIIEHFIEDCKFFEKHTTVNYLWKVGHDNVIFENGQGLLIGDKGLDTYDTTPSETGIVCALRLIATAGWPTYSLNVHYVTRPYLTRHGDGPIAGRCRSDIISGSIVEDRTNHYNAFQGKFRYGKLDIPALKERIELDMGGYCKKAQLEVEVTHCDEMDRVAEFRKEFDKVNTYDSPLIK